MRTFIHHHWRIHCAVLLLGQFSTTLAAQPLFQRNYSGLPDGNNLRLSSEASRLTDLVNAYFRTTGFQVLDVGLYDLSLHMQGEQSFDAAFASADAEVQGQPIPTAHQPILRSSLNLPAYLLMVWQVAADGRSLNLRWKLRLPDNGTLPPSELQELENILNSMGSQVAEQQLSQRGLSQWSEAEADGVKKIADLLERKMRGEKVLAGEVYLTKIGFKGFFPIDFNDTPEWKNIPGGVSTSSPLCYVKGSKFQLFPEISCDAEKAEGKNIRLKIKYLNTESLPVEANYDSNGKIIKSSSVEGVWFFLEDKVNYIPTLTIEWYLNTNGGVGEWISVGVSHHEVFVVFNKPNTNLKIRKDHLFFGCSQAKGIATFNDFVASIWSSFSSLKLNLKMFQPEKNAIPFTYYRNPVGGCTNSILDASPIQSNGVTIIDAECGAFAELFERVLKAQGIVCERELIIPKTDNGFLVKLWNFKKETKPGESYPFRNLFRTEDPRSTGNVYSKWIQPTALDDQPGLAGQNVANPYSDFKEHYVVIIDKGAPQQEILGNEVFDPSYGKMYKTLNEWAESSIAGFLATYTETATKGIWEFKARKSTDSSQEVQFKGK